MVSPVNPAAINAYAQAAKMATSGASSAPGMSFGEVLGDIVQDALKTGKQAESKAAGLVQGKGDLVDVVTAVNSAEMSLQTVVAIRDKVIAAYQDILRMPI